MSCDGAVWGRAWILHAAFDATVVRPAGGASATVSDYETAKLRSTSRHLSISTDQFGLRRLTVGAVNARSGNLRSSSTPRRTGIGPGTSWRAGCCRPAFPAVEIEGEHYWDGGSFPTRRSKGSSKTCDRHTSLPSRSISGTPAAIFLAIWPKSRRGGRRSSIRAEPAPARAASSACKGCAMRRRS